MSFKERRAWLDQAVTEALSAGPATVANVREEVDNALERTLCLDDDCPGCGKDVATPSALDFMSKVLRTRTQMVRRSLGRLVADGIAEQETGPGAFGDPVATFHLVGWSPPTPERQLADLRLAKAKAELQHQAQLRSLRQHLAGLCDHVQPRTDCLACQGFLLAGGEFATKDQEAEAVGGAA